MHSALRLIPWLIQWLIRWLIPWLIIVSLLLAAAAAMTAPVRAASAERLVLDRLAGEIVALERLVADAERRADDGDRVFFDYAQLRRDLAEIRAGVEAYTRETRPAPLKPLPLLPHYVRTTP
jgi:RAQPRD family integrative conjugative element protein